MVSYPSHRGPSLPREFLTPQEAGDLRAHRISIVGNGETTAASTLDGYGANVVDARAGFAGAALLAGGVQCDVNKSETTDFGQWDFVQEEPDVTPEQEAVLRDIQIQLRGPGLTGWPQLGTDAQGDHLTLVDGLAAALQRIAELEQESTGLRTQIGELRTEISELEATTADLVAEVNELNGPRWPWPLSLIEGPAAVVGEQLARLESLLPELPGLPGRESDQRESAGNGKSVVLESVQRVAVRPDSPSSP